MAEARYLAPRGHESSFSYLFFFIFHFFFKSIEHPTWTLEQEESFSIIHSSLHTYFSAFCYFIQPSSSPVNFMPLMAPVGGGGGAKKKGSSLTQEDIQLKVSEVVPTRTWPRS